MVDRINRGGFIGIKLIVYACANDICNFHFYGNNLKNEKNSKLLEECKKQILQQYLYLINEAEKQKDIAAANRLKATYTEKYGRNILISKPQHDDKFFRHFFLCFAAILALILFIILISLSRL